MLPSYTIFVAALMCAMCVSVNSSEDAAAAPASDNCASTLKTCLNPFICKGKDCLTTYFKCSGDCFKGFKTCIEGDDKSGCNDQWASCRKACDDKHTETCGKDDDSQAARKCTDTFKTCSDGCKEKSKGCHKDCGSWTKLSCHWKCFTDSSLPCYGNVVDAYIGQKCDEKQ